MDWGQTTSFLGLIRRNWLYMLEPPWRHSGTKETPEHWLTWLIGWVWALAGVVLGAVFTPSLLQFADLSDTPYQGWLIVSVAVLAGFFVQLAGWSLVCLVRGALLREVRRLLPRDEFDNAGTLRLLIFATIVWIHVAILALLPLAVVSYALYRYFTWIGVGQREITIAFVGALLVKTFLIPFIKGIVTGALFKWFMNWLHSGKGKDPQSA